MDQRFKEHINPKKFMLSLAALFVFFGVGVIFVSDFFIVPVAALYALVLLYFKENKFLCAMLPLPILAASFFNGIGAVFSVCFAFCAGAVLWQMYRTRLTKFDTVFAVTAIFSLYLLLALFLAVGAITNEYTLSAFAEYYEEFVETQKVAFVNACSDFYVIDEQGANVYLFTEETAEALFLSVARLVIAFFVIAGFFLCGLSCKIFSRIVRYAERDESEILAWRFLPPSLYVYFYLAAYVASFFAASEESIFSFAVQNIFYIFMIVFAYMGIQYLVSVIAKTRKKGFFLLLIAFFLLALNISAVQILSFLGAYVTIGTNRTRNV